MYRNLTTAAQCKFHLHRKHLTSVAFISEYIRFCDFELGAAHWHVCRQRIDNIDSFVVTYCCQKNEWGFCWCIAIKLHVYHLNDGGEFHRRACVFASSLRIYVNYIDWLPSSRREIRFYGLQFVVNSQCDGLHRNSARCWNCFPPITSLMSEGGDFLIVSEKKGSFCEDCELEMVARMKTGRNPQVLCLPFLLGIRYHDHVDWEGRAIYK